jgi:class 3 adenylate cyclase
MPLATRVETRDALVTVLFVDLRDFTSFAHGTTAWQAVERLNEFFGVVVPVLTDHGGHVDNSSATECWRCSERPNRSPTTRTARSPLRRP